MRERSTGSAEGVAGGDPYRRTFVGRETELAQLQAAFDTASSGNGGVILLAGEPGIGKTALWERFATQVSALGGRTLVGHSYEESSLSLPYLAFVEAIRVYVLTCDPEGLNSDLSAGAAEVARIVPELRDRVQIELREAGDPEEDRWRLREGVATFLRNAASGRPLTVVLEDLHWANPGTLDLLLHVARNLQGARVLVVGTYRDVELPRTHPLHSALAELRRTGNFLRSALTGLSVDEVHRMYEAIRGREVPRGQAELVQGQTEGNPLFVQEVLRYQTEEGIVALRPGQALAAGLRDIVGHRLSRLGEGAQRTLPAASVIGRDFRLDVLQKVVVSPEEEVFAALEEAQERAIIEPREIEGRRGLPVRARALPRVAFRRYFSAATDSPAPSGGLGAGRGLCLPPGGTRPGAGRALRAKLRAHRPGEGGALRRARRASRDSRVRLRRSSTPPRTGPPGAGCPGP
jgi:predicted ATPase